MEEEKEGNILRRKIFGPRWRRKTERVKGEIIWRKKIFGLRRRRKAEKEKGGNNLRRDIFGSHLGRGQLGQSSPPGFSSTHEMVSGGEEEWRRKRRKIFGEGKSDDGQMDKH